MKKNARGKILRGDGFRKRKDVAKIFLLLFHPVPFPASTPSRHFLSSKLRDAELASTNFRNFAMVCARDFVFTSVCVYVCASVMCFSWKTKFLRKLARQRERGRGEDKFINETSLSSTLYYSVCTL